MNIRSFETDISDAERPRLAHLPRYRLFVEPDLPVQTRDVAVGDETIGKSDVEQSRGTRRLDIVAVCRDTTRCGSTGKEFRHLGEQSSLLCAVLHGNPYRITVCEFL